MATGMAPLKEEPWKWQQEWHRYATILFDTGADRSFVSNTFSATIDITPTTLENHYDVELADGKIIGVNWYRIFTKGQKQS
ncbi:hypothetical protein Tco_0197615 [Tanacetum coccineum]